jgi:predicted deacetylase
MEMTLSEFYNLLSNIFIALIVISVLIFLFVKFRLNLRFFRRIAEFSEKHQKGLVVFFLILVIGFIVAFGITKYVIYDLDKSTTVVVDEKIVIIELDDWWNFNDIQDYHKRYGYTFERFRSVTDIIDKYDFTATMGVTPHIFLEEIRQNIPLEDDPEMVDYINEMVDKGYEIGMHGYNHCRNEHYCPQYEEVWYNVDTGKRELEALFGVRLVSYFPPGNTWTTEQYENVKRAGFKLIGNTHVPKAYFDDDVIITQRGYDPIYVYKWYARDFRHCPVEDWITAYDLTYNKDKSELLKSIIAGFENIDEYDQYSDDEAKYCNFMNYKAYQANNLFILQLHQNTFDNQEKLDDLDEFFSYIKEDGAKVMTYKEFYNYIMEKRKTEGKSLTGQVILKVN